MGFSDWFSKDGKATIFIEGLPVLGYVAAAVQAASGNTVRTNRQHANPSLLFTGESSAFIRRKPSVPPFAVLMA